ncbi:MAG: chromate resistance protein ChrB domain-containing protein [Candidatus Heimdallarchaeaceae archaeon]
MLWVTRDYVHVDRVACPWLIKQFVDKKAQFIFLPREEITEFVEKTGAIPFDTGTGIELDHFERDGIKYCTFDAIIEKYNLTEDPALAKLRKIVRSGDTEREPSEKLAYGLEAVASGAPLLCESDHDALELEFPFYDILYAYLQREVILERYKKEIAELKTRGERRNFIKEKMKEL